MMVGGDDLQLVHEALGPLPTERGGQAVVLASEGPPPALALVSTGSVWLEGDMLRAAVLSSSSVVARLGASFSALVLHPQAPLRVAVHPATARAAGAVSVLEGQVVEIRATTEPPWETHLRFESPGGPESVRHVEYWRALRGWLQAGATGHPPTLSADRAPTDRR